MKLFIWEGTGVLEDYTSGMIIALAPTLEEAYKVIERVDGIATYQLEGKERVFNFPKEPTSIIDLDLAMPQAWTCWGGG